MISFNEIVLFSVDFNSNGKAFLPKLAILSSVSPKGKIIIDEGALSALNNGKSLLAAGITRIKGSFDIAW